MMDQSSIIHLFQPNDNFNMPQEIVLVEGTEPVAREEVAQESVDSPQHGDDHAEPEEREVCPVTELCTIQVVTITVKGNVPEVSEVTIPNALASSLKFTCKICDKSFPTFSEFQTHAKCHLQVSGDQSASSSLCMEDESNGNDDSTDTCHTDYEKDSTNIEASESSQMEAIARELIDLASSPQTKKLCTSTARNQKSCNKSYVKGAVAREIAPAAQAEANCFATLACSVCDTKFAHDYTWEEHMKVRHEDVQPYQCAVCAKECNNMPALRGHVVKIHQKFSQMVCENKWNKRKKTVKGEPPVVCQLCRGSGNSDPFILEKSEKVIPPDDLQTLRNRMSRRAESSGYTKCPICTKVLSNMYLQKHVKLHTEPKSHACSYCDKVYRTIGDLTRHERIHTGEKPFKCIVCGKAFSLSSAIARHMKVHTQEKSYKCLVCEKCFTRRDGLIKHMAIHNGEKRFECNQCHESYRQKRYLIRHYKSVHGYNVKTEV